MNNYVLYGILPKLHKETKLLNASEKKHPKLCHRNKGKHLPKTKQKQSQNLTSPSNSYHTDKNKHTVKRFKSLTNERLNQCFLPPKTKQLIPVNNTHPHALTVSRNTKKKQTKPTTWSVKKRNKAGRAKQLQNGRRGSHFDVPLPRIIGLGNV